MPDNPGGLECWCLARAQPGRKPPGGSSWRQTAPGMESHSLACFSWLRRGFKHQSTDLQRERKLLSVIVARRDLDGFDLQREWVLFHFVEEPGQRRQGPGRIHAAFKRHVIVSASLPLRFFRCDADPAVLLPAVEGLEHRAFGR